MQGEAEMYMRVRQTLHRENDRRQHSYSPAGGHDRRPGKQMKPDGGTMDGTTVYQRVSGGPGLGGKWRTKKGSGDIPPPPPGARGGGVSPVGSPFPGLVR